MALLKNFVPGYRALDLAVQLRGRPKSAYPEGRPAPGEGESDGETLGWTVRCRSGPRREIVALPGRTRPSVSVRERGSLTVVRGDFRLEITDASCQ
jgi:hypothetical protein